MREWTRIGLVAVALAACGAPSTGEDTSADTAAPTYPSDFTTGKYRVTRLELLPEGTGVDFDGDGEPDNNLPNALTAADTVLADLDLSPEGFNAQIAAAIAAGDLHLLLDLRYVDGVLTTDVISGLPTEGTDAPIQVDPTSYDDAGVPRARFIGEFSTQTDLAVSADDVLVPVPFLPGEPPSLVPLRQASLAGTADAGVEATLAGLIPSNRLADDVLADLIPPEGYGNLSREQLLRTLRAFAALESIADIPLSDTERAVSCALSVTAEPATWE
jgi:hypothetical protein